MPDEELDPPGLQVPDRFEGLRDVGSGTLRSIVVPVGPALDEIDLRFADLGSARRGGFMLLRGNTGAGKSTFLDTVGLFRKNVATERLPVGSDPGEALAALGGSDNPRILVMEGREALGEVSEAELEAAMHAINAFVRSQEGSGTLVVWPVNTDDLTTRLVQLGGALGGEALFGVGEPVTAFDGPDKSEFVGIAERTIAALNEGASLATLGISEGHAVELTTQSETIGRYLALVRRELLSNGVRVRSLMKAEQVRLWALVIAGNDPEGDVAALTRGGYAYADIDRMLTATGANVVKELKKQPDTLGILGTVLDAKILNMDMVTVLSVARTYGDDHLHALMRDAGMSTSADASALDRVGTSEIGLILSGASLGTRKPGSKPGSSTQTAFSNLAGIARTDDGALNRAIGRALVAAGLARDFQAEKDLESDLKYTSDLWLDTDPSPIRVEVMWRSTTSRAEIANYVLTKLGKYARAIKLLGADD